MVWLKSFFGVAPRFFGVIFPVVQEFGLKDFGEIHLCNEVVDFIGVDDDHQVFLAFCLPAFKLTYKRFDVGVGFVAPGLVEESPHVEIFLVGNDKLSLEMLDHLSKRYLQRLDADRIYRR